MKVVGAVLAVGITFVVVWAVAVFSFFPTQTPPVNPQPQVVQQLPPLPAAPTGSDPAQLETAVAQREAVYHDQIAKLQQALQERQTTYQGQMQTLSGQLAASQSQLEQLHAQEQALQAQIQQLEAARADRQGQYQAQLAQAQPQYQARFDEMQTMINDLKTKLAEANAQLGR
ncbi:MAG: hypothetical protein FOGNACKC_05308 [Anaerolineae bacterium]|nr:hypothetical protein [Anaerolineae bacterium]